MHVGVAETRYHMFEPGNAGVLTVSEENARVTADREVYHLLPVFRSVASRCMLYHSLGLRVKSAAHDDEKIIDPWLYSVLY